ncbi:hypothetical protein H9L14_00205 [Sphingomonas sediminicola]|uniref:Uncharacterized protein n=1 Tax=Sphingomonas sediminicola TaxID=386874 RepID=A0ABX6TBK8_9SPHN|nr:hypothetical protein [Sphingomonas sediminicola]QNP47060.1 hypothetical protein H9L14_00205 [Sphingomonas sediminicola]
MSEPKPKLPATKRDLAKSVTLSGRDLEDARRLIALLSEEEENQGTASELARLALARRPTRQEQLELRAREILALRQKRAELLGLQCSVNQHGRCFFSSTQWLEHRVNQ